jgi:hypothetical protein
MLNRTMIHTVVAGVAFAALTGCNTIPVTTDYNPELSVASCHTYAFAQEHAANTDHPAAFGNPLNGDRLRVAIAANLAAKGIQPAADRSTADCVVGYAMGTRQVFDDFYGGFGFSAGYGWGWGRRGYGGYWGYDGPWVRDETRITVDLFDAKSRKAIWHAVASQSVSDLTGPNAEARINAAAAAIFAKLPVGGQPPVAGRTSS